MLTGMGESTVTDSEGNEISAAGQLKKFMSFLPLLKDYHATVEIKDDEPNGFVSYLPIFKADGTILLCQCVYAVDKDTKRVYISRRLQKWDLTEFANTFIDTEDDNDSE